MSDLPSDVVPVLPTSFTLSEDLQCSTRGDCVTSTSGSAPYLSSHSPAVQYSTAVCCAPTTELLRCRCLRSEQMSRRAGLLQTLWGTLGNIEHTTKTPVLPLT